jgi:hypothetical protein
MKKEAEAMGISGLQLGEVAAEVGEVAAAYGSASRVFR